jgi:predicted Rossmann fold nucleotide-binding protein DprA/Smf involved in DNA uptake
MSEAGGQRKAQREVLKRLREERSSQVKAANAANAIVRGERKKVVAQMGEDPLSVRQVAEAAGLPTDRVLWHFAAMRKYGHIAETPTKDGDYYTYVLTAEARGGGRGKSGTAESTAAGQSDEESEEG